MTKRLLPILAVLLLASLIAAPYVGLPAHLQSLLYLIFFWVSLATSWNLLSGYSGYFSFGHGAFFGLGMYGMATFATKFNLSFFPSVFLSGLIAAALALVIGALVFRLRSIRGESFALITLAVTFVLATLIVNTPIDGGPGVYLMGVSTPAIGPSAASSFYYLGLGMATLCVFIAYILFYSKMGLGLLAIHDDEDVAEVNGVPTFALKMAAFALSSFLAGMMGSIHALYVSYVTVSETFNINVPLTVVLMIILGGARHWAGPTLCAVLITLLLNTFTDGNSALVGRVVIGVILTLSVLLMPNGIWGSLSSRFRSKRVQLKGGVSSPHTHEESRGREVLSERTAELALKGDTPVGSKVVLEVKGLTKQFFAIKALGGVDLKLYEGEILGLLGPNGSGKSTFINVVTGHFSATSGVVELLGRDVTHLSAHEIRKSGISRTYQIPRPFNGLTVLQNVVLSAQYGGSGINESQATQQALQWLEFTGLLDKAAELPDALNLHQRKFLELARALAARSQVLLLDEVLSGLTPSEIDLAVQTIRLIRQRGTSIVFVEHVMSAVMALSDRLVVLDQGMVIASGAPKDVMNDPEVVRAYLGDEVEGE